MATYTTTPRTSHAQRSEWEGLDEPHGGHHGGNAAERQSERRLLLKTPRGQESDTGNGRDEGAGPHHDRKRRPQIQAEQTEQHEAWPVAANSQWQ